jgi:cysteine-rich repeat protein
MKKMLALSAILVFAACGGDDDDKKDPGGDDGTEECGNAEVEGDEVCDDTDLDGMDCTTVAGDFTGGTLGCDGDCGGFDTSACEIAGAADACDAPVAITVFPTTRSNENNTGADTMADACGDTNPNPTLAYQLSVPAAGKVFVLVTPTDDTFSGPDFVIFARSTCATAEINPDIWCEDQGSYGEGEVAFFDVAGAQTLFVFVSGYFDDDVGEFDVTFDMASCDDGYIDLEGGEQCDDGGTTPGDGCSGTCTVEADEDEAGGNSTAAEADNYTTSIAPVYGVLTDDLDDDMWSFVATATTATVEVTSPVGDPDLCLLELIDTRATVFESDGTTPRANNDDTHGWCPVIDLTGLTVSNTYYVLVDQLGDYGFDPAPYELTITMP